MRRYSRTSTLKMCTKYITINLRASPRILPISHLTAIHLKSRHLQRLQKSLLRSLPKSRIRSLSKSRLLRVPWPPPMAQCLHRLSKKRVCCLSRRRPSKPRLRHRMQQVSNRAKHYSRSSRTSPRRWEVLIRHTRWSIRSSQVWATTTRRTRSSLSYRRLWPPCEQTQRRRWTT